MKRVIILVVSLLLVTLCFSQEKQSRIVLKSGTVVTGTIVEFDPTSHITLKVAGFETRFEMSDIASIEDAAAVAVSSTVDKDPVAEEKDQYPPVRVITVGPYELELILVKGGQFQVGYDGKGSHKLRSEPVHDVILSDFYVNKVPLQRDVVSYLRRGNDKSNNSRSYHAVGWNEANGIANDLAEATNLPFQLITESQLEYIATTNAINLIEVEKMENNYCKDWFDEFHKTFVPLVDPEGPTRGKGHVVRSLSAVGVEVYRRLSSEAGLGKYLIRITVPAAAMTSE